MKHWELSARLEALTAARTAAKGTLRPNGMDGPDEYIEARLAVVNLLSAEIESCEKELVRCLVDDLDGEKRGAADASGELGSIRPIRAGVIPALIRAAARYDRAGPSARRALVGMDEKALPVLIDMLSHDDDVLRCGAAWALEAFGARAKDAVPMLERLLGDRTPVRTHAAIAIWAITGCAREMAPVVAEVFRGCYDEVVYVGCGALREMGPEAAGIVPMLTAALRSADGWTREHAALALSGIGYPAAEALSALADALRDEDDGVRANACIALAEFQSLAEFADLVIATFAAGGDDPGVGTSELPPPKCCGVGQNEQA